MAKRKNDKGKPNYINSYLQGYTKILTLDIIDRPEYDYFIRAAKILEDICLLSYQTPFDKTSFENNIHEFILYMMQIEGILELFRYHDEFKRFMGNTTDIATFGNNKYSPYNYKEVHSHSYIAALIRHFFEFTMEYCHSDINPNIDNILDVESGIRVIDHIYTNCLILLDDEVQERLCQIQR